MKPNENIDFGGQKLTNRDGNLNFGAPKLAKPSENIDFGGQKWTNRDGNLNFGAPRQTQVQALSPHGRPSAGRRRADGAPLQHPSLPGMYQRPSLRRLYRLRGVQTSGAGKHGEVKRNLRIAII